MNKKLHFFQWMVVVAMLASALNCFAQEIEKDEDKSKESKKKKYKYDASRAVLIDASFNGQLPFGNMRQHFGYNSLFSAQILYKTNRNWLIGAEGGFIYGVKVKDNVLANLQTSMGTFITQYSDVTTVVPEEHGFNLKATFGKIFPFTKRFPDAGILILTGVGMLQHKIAINVKADELPQLSPVYRTGYDRLSNGPAISQFIGATFIARKWYLNGYAGVEFDLAYTQDRRPYDFYLMEPWQNKSADMFLGFKIAYIIPVFLETSEKEYYYY